MAEAQTRGALRPEAQDLAVGREGTQIGGPVLAGPLLAEPEPCEGPTLGRGRDDRGRVAVERHAQDTSVRRLPQQASRTQLRLHAQIHGRQVQHHAPARAGARVALPFRTVTPVVHAAIRVDHEQGATTVRRLRIQQHPRRRVQRYDGGLTVEAEGRGC